MADRFIQLVIALAIFGLIVRNPGNFSDLMRGLKNTYVSFIGGITPAGSFR